MQKKMQSCFAAATFAAILAAGPIGCAFWEGDAAREIDSAVLTQPQAYDTITRDQNVVNPHQPLMPAINTPAPTPATTPKSVHAAHSAEPKHTAPAPALHKPAPPAVETIPSAATDALARLRVGNERFRTNLHDSSHLGQSRRQELTAGQHPFATILCCSDSRVPPEIIFDQGLGDIFIIRIAGNVADPDVTASVEYAAEHLHTPLVVVLGHSQCGAVTAAVAGGEAPGSIPELLAKIKPSVEMARAAGLTDKNKILGCAIDENVRHWVKDLQASPVVKELGHEGKIYVIGARYDLETGRVEWLK